MAKGVYIETTGVRDLILQLRGMDKKVTVAVSAEVHATAQDIERTAAQRVRKDHSFLANSIKAKNLGVFDAEVVAGMHYAPYVEFGTGALVEVPKDLEAYARQFMAPRPVKRAVNLPARPFLFPTFYAEVAKLETRLAKKLQKLQG